MDYTTETVQWSKQRYALAPPYSIERLGHCFIICDRAGNNIARREGGAVLFWPDQRVLAEAVLVHLEA
jgi:hypothetical protein